VKNLFNQRLDVFKLLERIRACPAMWLGEWSLVRLQAFVNGFVHAAKECGADLKTLPDDLHEWVADRSGRSYSTQGWCNTILDDCGGDDAKALSRFFELIDEYRNTHDLGGIPEEAR
jgi:hypothetical protein